MTTFPAVYRAKAVSIGDSGLTALVPQVFGDVPILITDYIGTVVPGMGWVLFQAGDTDHPVWVSPVGGGGGGGGGEGGQDEVYVGPSNPGNSYELWYDTDDPGGSMDLLWVGPNAPTNPTTEIWWDTDEPTTVEQFVNTSGDAMTGPLTLPGDPALALQAATKQYVDGGSVINPTLGSGITASSAQLIRTRINATQWLISFCGGFTNSSGATLGIANPIYTIPVNCRPAGNITLVGAVQVVGIPTLVLVVQPDGVVRVASSWSTVLTNGSAGFFAGSWVATV